MADAKISDLTAVTAAAAAQEIPVNDAGTTKKLTVAQLKTLLGGVTCVALAANATANATTTAAVITNLTTTVGVGTWVFQYWIRYQSSVTTTGVKFSVNHTGTVTSFTANLRYTSTGGAAATAAATQAGNSATGNIHESFSARAKSTAAGMGPTVSVDAANSDMLCVMEGLMVVTVSGNIELYHASETAASTQVMAGSCLILHQVA